jgi:hypothetical protein
VAVSVAYGIRDSQDDSSVGCVVLPFSKILSQLKELKDLGESQQINGQHSLLSRQTGG